MADRDRTKYQMRRNRVQLRNRVEALLEEAFIKWSSVVSDLLGVSARRMLQGIADGETDPAVVAGMADGSLRATPKELCDALRAAQELGPVHRHLVKMALDELQLIDQQIGQLDQEMASLLRRHEDQVQRLAEVPGLGVDSAQQIIAEVGVVAATFPSAAALSSWVGACPGEEETAGVNHRHRSPKGNRHTRRLLNHAPNSANKHHGSIFQILYSRYVPRLGHNQTIAVIAHRLCRLIWKILDQGVHYEERGPAVNERTQRRRTARTIRHSESSATEWNWPILHRLFRRERGFRPRATPWLSRTGEIVLDPERVVIRVVAKGAVCYPCFPSDAALFLSVSDN